MVGEISIRNYIDVRHFEWLLKRGSVIIKVSLKKDLFLWILQNYATENYAKTLLN
jgi:hypothetical protein